MAASQMNTVGKCRGWEGWNKNFLQPLRYFHGDDDDDDEMSHLNGHALNEIKMNEKKDEQKRSLNCEK